MKKHIIATFVIIILPFVLMAIGRSPDEAISNFGQLAELLFLSPALIAKEVLFEFQKDIGLIPTNSARYFVVMLYIAIYWSVLFIFRQRGANGISNS